MNRAKRFARQRLFSLRQSGLEVLPTPKQIHQFELLVSAQTSVSDDAVCESSVATQVSRTVEKTPDIGTRSDEAGGWFAGTEHSYQSAPLGFDDRKSALSVVESEVSKCKLCSDLASCRRKTVFGVGNPKPELCFLGEGPGADEDRQGEPFVGAAGQLLNKIIEACKMSRDDVYILNTVKCRPPGNRNPNDEELENCWPYAVRQLDILQPDFICCLGSVAARTLLETKQSIGRMRGQFFRYRGSQVLVTYHPAYLLRNPAAKRQVWDDMKMLLAAMGRQL